MLRVNLYKVNDSNNFDDGEDEFGFIVIFDVKYVNIKNEDEKYGDEDGVRK